MASRGIDELDSYLTLLLRESDELSQLTELLTVNETYFFREPDHLKLLIDTLLPELMAERSGRPVRIVSAGCSTGEEPYSVAIKLQEKFGPESQRLCAITAVDIDSTAITQARQGVYGSSSFRGICPAILERYFEPAGTGKYRVTSGIRKQVEFETANLLGPSYPARMLFPDIILYRNVSIYFPQQVQREIFGRLADLLAEGGCLLVGASETIHHDVGILSLVKRDSLFFYKKSPKFIIAERRMARRQPPPLERTDSRVALSTATGGLPRNQAPPVRTVTLTRASRLDETKRLFDEAIECAHKKLYDRALSILDDINEREESFEKAISLKGSLLMNVDRFAEARDVCESILEKNTLCLEAYLMLGMIARRHGDDEGAFKRFRDAIYLDSLCWPAHYFTGEILFAQQEWKRSRSSYDAARTILENGSAVDHGRKFFPLSFNAEQFIVMCRHKLSLLKEKK